MRSRVKHAAASSLGTLIVVVLPFAAYAQDWKGSGRVEGAVVDEAGQPIPDTTVKAYCGERGGGTTLKTDKKGRFVLGGVVACNWAIDVEAAGYEPRQLSVRLVSESTRMPPVKVPLKKASQGGSPELVAAAAKADAAYMEGRFAEARAEYEKLLTLRPELAPTIHQQIGFSYIQEKQFDKALASLDQVLTADPANAQIRAIAAQAALEGRMVDRARTLLAGLDESKIDSPDVFFNIGINFFNAGEVQDAISYFGKAIAKDPAHVDAYYRRALAYLGQGKSAEARADLQKVVQLQPDAEMGAAAKKALEQLK